MNGVVSGGWNFVVAAYTVTALVLIIYGVTVLTRLRDELSRAGYFQCNRLMVSHNNEYKAPKGGHPIDKKELEKLMRTTEGLDNKS